MKKENKLKFEKMVAETLTKFWEDSYNYRIYEILQKAAKYHKEESMSK